MTTGNTTLLGLALPVEGELDGTWGDVVNDSITSLVDSAVAGTTTLSVDADVTLTTTVLAANQARQAIILWTASNGATTRNITAPAQSKPYIVINAGTGSIVLRGAGPTTGVTIVSGEKCLAAWNGSDFVKVSSSVSIDGSAFGTAPVAYTSGKYYMTTGVVNGTFGWNTSFASPVIFYYPVFIPKAINVDRLAAQVFSTGTSSFEVAIYSDSNGVPSSRVATSGSLSGATTGLKTATVSASLTPGVWWFAIGFSTNSITMNGTNGMLNFVSGGDSNLTGIYGTYYYSTLGSGSSMLPLPASAPSYTLFVGGDGPSTVPSIYFRIS